ncbi:interferon-inducible GTPase 5-like [Sorex araneus]|uniref:interferon-inducible GTPase 5-like n=1 Tax=Sorex araneus TaxID=42254 RepID=UPI002433683C|nr:interferon-inducible GTPase 5-like [Sorex araneus]
MSARALMETFEVGSLPAVAAKLQATLQALENVQLDIGITGSPGSGKSTLVNALRGLGDEDMDSAQTSVVETKVAPTPYPHRQYLNVVIWDLPGIGPASFQADKYLQQVLQKPYDLLLLLSAGCFPDSLAQLACRLGERGTHFCLVRSKVDVDVAASRSRRPSTFSEDAVLSQIRNDCAKRLEAEGLKDPRVFLISAFKLTKYDFPQLQEAMVQGLAGHKRHALLVAMPTVSQGIIERKAEALRQHIWLVALVACSINQSPVPGVKDVECDLALLARCLQGYHRSLGLDTGSPGVAEGTCTCISQVQVAKLLHQASGVMASAFTRELLQVPVLRCLTTRGLSFGTIYQMLRLSLDTAIQGAREALLQASDRPQHQLADGFSPLGLA